MSDESAFGDSEPEDAWHPDDEFPTQVENLRRRLDLLELIDEPALDAIERRLAPWRDRIDSLRPRDQVRVRQLAEDLEFLRSRER